MKLYKRIAYETLDTLRDFFAAIGLFTFTLVTLAYWLGYLT